MPTPTSFAPRWSTSSLGAPADMRAQHAVWNADAPGPVPAKNPDTWAPAVAAARQRLLAQNDLLSQLQGFVAQIP